MSAFLIAILSLLVIVPAAALLIVTRTEFGFRFYLNRLYRRKFSDVGLIEPDDLLHKVASGATPVLLDTRTPQEFAVSHIAGAISIDPGNFSLDSVGKLNRDQPVVVYCSIGYRSGRIARHLRSFGFTNVRNLYGGLFLWYNQRRPVVRDGRRVEQIHPYDATWRMFITRGGATRTPI